MKKKTLSIWTWLSILFVFLTGFFLLFGLVYEVVGLYHVNNTEVPLGAIALFDFAALLEPFKLIFYNLPELFTNFSSTIEQRPYVLVLFVIAVLFIVLLVLQLIFIIIKKRPKYLLTTLYLGVLSVIVAYCFVLILMTPRYVDPSHEFLVQGQGLLNAIIKGKGTWLSILTFTKPFDALQSIFVYLFLVSLLLVFVSIFVIYFTSFKRIFERVEKPAIVPVEEDIVNVPEEKGTKKVEEIEALPEEKKTLITRRFDAYASNNMVEKECDYPRVKLSHDAFKKEIRNAIRNEFEAQERLQNEVNSTLIKDLRVSISANDNIDEVEEDYTPIVFTIPTGISEINGEGNIKKPTKRIKTEVHKQYLTRDDAIEIVKDEFEQAIKKYFGEQPIEENKTNEIEDTNEVNSLVFVNSLEDNEKNDIKFFYDKIRDKFISAGFKIKSADYYETFYLNGENKMKAIKYKNGLKLYCNFDKYDFDSKFFKKFVKNISRKENEYEYKYCIYVKGQKSIFATLSFVEKYCEKIIKTL